MNTNALNKLYHQLTAQERLALMIAAGRREDTSERKQLADTAPRQQYEKSHHHNLATALLETARLHLLTLLDLAAKYWQWWGLCGWQLWKRQITNVADPGAAVEAGLDPAEEDEVRQHGLLRYHAFLFVTHVDGWKKFCATWPIEPEALLDYLPGWDMVTRTETPAREHAYSLEDAALFLLSETPIPEESAEDIALPAVITVEGLAEAWQSILDRQVPSESSKGRY
jgi:hypothetical protein